MRNGDNIHIRTGRSYGGILHNSRNESQNAYNDAYYDTGTTFDRFGNRLNRANLCNDRSRARESDCGRQNRNQRGYVSGNYYNPEIVRRYAAHGHSDLERAEAQRTEAVTEYEYNSATLSGTYHNLDNPKKDIRDFSEGGQSEE